MVSRTALVPALLFWPVALAAVAAPNIYPDPGFETTGVAGMARSGERAGCLEVGDPIHWAALGGGLAVEPYATYRATAWVKGGGPQGSLQALYVYHWDSYVWAFSTTAPIPSVDEWREVSVTFRSPTSRIELHPLAFTDSAHSKAWVDDLIVERIATPEETIAAIEAAAHRTPDETRLLARWYVEHGEFAKAEALLTPDGDHPAMADVACVIAKATGDPALGARMLAAMIAYGAPSYNDGAKRIAEVAARLPSEALLPALRGRALASLDAPADLEILLRETARTAGAAAGPEPLGARAARVEHLAELGAQLRRAAAGKPEALAVVERFETEVATMAEGISEARAHLGRAMVNLRGRTVTAATHAIALPAEPTPQEKLAANDLAAHLERITGESLEVVPENRLGGRLGLYVGRCAAIGRELGLTVDYARLGDEGIRIRNVGPQLVLTGGKRGVLYAVYTFLEDTLGCRWFTADCATWPTEGEIRVPPLDIEKVPALEYRSTDYPNSRPAEFAVRNKLNGNAQEIPEEWGGKISYVGFVHTFNALVPPERYFAAHPEYYSEIGGERRNGYQQLCLTNPDVLRIATESVRQWLRENPRATIVSVSQNDNIAYCQCPECTKVADEEGGQSGLLLRFVNAIAEDIAEDYPHIIVDTLAYQYTRKPPRITKPRPNVAVRLCSIECEFNRPLADSPYNATFVDDIRGWHAICNRLHIWDYVINYAHSVQPFPNLRVLQPNIRFFIDNGVTGIYEEANYFSRGGELAELRTYLMAKALWDPDRDLERATDEFLAAYYGPAAGPIRAYLDDIHDKAVSDPEFHMPIYVGPHGPFQTPEAIAHYKTLFDQAEAAVQDDPVRLHRVEVARLPILYTEIVRNLQPVYHLGADSLLPGTSGDAAEAVARFERIARAEGVTQVSEGGLGANFEAWIAQMRQGASGHPVVRLEGGGLEAVIVPDLGGRLLSLRRASDGLEIVVVAEAEGGIAVGSGGYEEYTERGYQSPGYREPYQVLARDDRSVTLGADLPNGIRIERTYALEAEAARLTVRTKLTNPGPETRAPGLRVHPAFRIGDPAEVRLDLGGGTEIALTEMGADGGERYLRGADRPAGQWSLIDRSRDVRITNRFESDKVEECYVNWSRGDRRANIELWCPTTKLAAGASWEIVHSYEIGQP